MSRWRTFAAGCDKQRRIMWALMLREFSTRYGRDNIGFLWVIAEPIIFASGVAFVRTLIEPPFLGGIGLVPFVLTGYLPLILARNAVNHSASAVRVNQALLYHRQITVLQIFLCRISLEMIGVTMASLLVIFFTLLTGVMPPPPDFLSLGLIYTGWFLLAWQGAGMAMILGALAEIYDPVERVVPIVTYLLIPLSGAFFMCSMVAPKVRALLLLGPFVHCFEMIRKGFFGAHMMAYYNIPYAVLWAAGLFLGGLLLVRLARDQVEIE